MTQNLNSLSYFLFNSFIFLLCIKANTTKLVVQHVMIL